MIKFETAVSFLSRRLKTYFRLIVLFRRDPFLILFDLIQSASRSLFLLGI
jgi:hypothetical protein